MRLIYTMNRIRQTCSDNFLENGEGTEISENCITKNPIGENNFIDRQSLLAQKSRTYVLNTIPEVE